ncbi:MAG: LuxR family transcriptional regulator [Thiomicrospira sp.]|jgi:DNA-binding CsgD family transcriptional regulator|nr:LuxR family transcriptional regulator [Thiomicrospira sp.]
MDKRLYQLYESILVADSLTEVEQITQQIVEKLGFSHFVYLFIRHSDNKTEPQVVQFGTYPKAWIEQYIAQRYDLIDPCALHVRNHQQPLVWLNDLFSESASLRRYYAQAKSFGVSCGASFAVVRAFPKESAGMSIAKPGDANEQVDEVIAILPYGQLLTCYVHEAVVRLLKLSPPQPKRALTEREKACVRLAAQGLNDTVIADKLFIHLRTVRFHLSNAREKLGAKTRSQLIARALETNAIGL